MHVGDDRPRRKWRKQPRREERRPDKPQASQTQPSASRRELQRDDLREEHRAYAEGAKRQRHDPAVAAQLVFADEVSRVELWLEEMQARKQAQERSHQPEGQAGPNRGGLRSVPLSHARDYGFRWRTTRTATTAAFASGCSGRVDLEVASDATFFIQEQKSQARCGHTGGPLPVRQASDLEP
jgi:hypothetical protein